MIDDWTKIIAMVCGYIVINVFAIVTMPIWFMPYTIWFHLDEKKKLLK